MEEVYHFGHQKHLLKLVDWETILSAIKGGDEENLKGVVVVCDLCQEPLLIGDSAYACTMCQFFLHKLCSQLPETINLPFLYQHPLNIYMIMNLSGLYYCTVCCQRITMGFAYLPKAGDKPTFNCRSNCFLVEFARMTEVDAIKEEALIKLQHEGHPQHTLTLQLRPASFCCDACNAKDEGLFYECDSCDFWIHKSCASLALTINIPHHPKHPLVLVYSLPEKFYNFHYYCKFCKKIIRRNEWLYHCANCRYFAHIKCALNAQHQPCAPRDDPSTSAASEDVNSLLHFPISEAFIDPFKLLHSKILAQDDKEATEINHWSHLAHPLILLGFNI
ncbi:C1-like protein [Tanacetum coccineum]